jgi:U3 small nucleolar RNA-associated protein MPP10
MSKKRKRSVSNAPSSQASSVTERSPVAGKIQELLSSLVENFCNSPERFFTTNKNDADQLLKTTKKLYDFIKEKEQQSGQIFSSLPELYTDGLDLEQIWEELQLQNTPTVEFLSRRIQTLEEYEPSEHSEEEEGEEEQEDSMQSSSDDSDVESDGGSGGAKDIDDGDGDVKFTGLGTSSDEDDSEHDSNDEKEDKKSSSSVLTEEQRKRILARKIAERAMMDDGEGEANDVEERVDPDRFFNMEDFEAFADGHEDMGNLMNVIVDEYDQLEEMESEDEDGRLNQDDEDMEEYRVDKEDKKSLDSVKEPSYKDFFDPIDKIKSKKKSTTVDDDDDDNFNSSDSEESSSSSEEEEEEDSVLGDSSFKKKHKGSRNNTDFGNGGDDKEEDGGDSESEEEEEEEEEELSRHEKYQLEMKQKIKDFEEENVKRRSWELMGEVGAGQRPKSSLLEAEMDYQMNTKTAPVITPDVTATLEDMIKERIKQELWDDVERRSVDDFSSRKKKELADVSTEKSKIGLGEIYAQEFEQRFLGAAQSGEEEVNKREQEIFTLWKKLSSQLDSLTNFHYTPKPKFNDMEVRQNVSAIQMEEVIPMGVSTEVSVAPEEIMSKKKGREGILKGDEESTPEERQRARRAKKVARRKARQAKLADEKAVARANPGLGNKYAMRTAMEGLSRARNVTIADNVDGDVRWTKSSDVFKKLQDEVKSSFKNHFNSADDKKKKGKGGNGYKL